MVTGYEGGLRVQGITGALWRDYGWITEWLRSIYRGLQGDTGNGVVMGSGGNISSREPTEPVINELSRAEPSRYKK